MSSIYDRIRGRAPVRQQSMVQPLENEQPNVTGFEGMMSAPTALSKHVDTQEKAGEFENFVEQNPSLKGAMDKVSMFVEQLRQQEPDLSPEEAQQKIQLFLAQEYL